MEHQKPHEIAHRLLEARHDLRANLILETTLIERIAELPEDDFCHFSREAFQMGAGYAYQQREVEDVSFDDVLATFFATRPRNRYLDPEVVEAERSTVNQAAFWLLETGEMPQLESHVDPYQVEAVAAFAEGFMVTASLISSQSSETEVA